MSHTPEMLIAFHPGTPMWKAKICAACHRLKANRQCLAWGGCRGSLNDFRRALTRENGFCPEGKWGGKETN